MLKKILGAVGLLFVLTTCSVLVGPQGEPGKRGDNGVDGQNGQDGLSCSVAPVDPSDDFPQGGVLITCPTSNALVLNGAPGEDADVSFGIKAVVDPCGDTGSVYDEVLLILSNDQILASFSENTSGKNTRLSYIPDGNYMTTDGSNCYFSVSSSEDNRTISWPGGVYSWQFMN